MSDTSPIERIEASLKDYYPSADTVELVKTTPTVLLAGPSGAGKDTAKQGALVTGDYYHLISYTTRPPRVNNGQMEVDGIDYHFVSPAKAEKMVTKGDFIELNVYGGNVYGTAAADLAQARAAGKIAITDIDVNGVANFMKLSADSNSVTPFFILPHSIEAWRKRILSRGDLSPEQLIARGKTAVRELRIAQEVPYYRFVINESAEEMVATICHMVNTGNVDEQKQRAGRELSQTLLEQAVQILNDRGVQVN